MDAYDAVRNAVWDAVLTVEDPLATADARDAKLDQVEEVAWKVFEEAVGRAGAERDAAWKVFEEATWKLFDDAVIAAKATRNAIRKAAVTRKEEAAWKAFFEELRK